MDYKVNVEIAISRCALATIKETKQTIGKTSKLKRQKILSIVNNIKSKGCIICGETNIACLDFHHLRDKKR